MYTDKINEIIDQVGFCAPAENELIEKKLSENILEINTQCS